MLPLRVLPTQMFFLGPKCDLLSTGFEFQEEKQDPGIYLDDLTDNNPELLQMYVGGGGSSSSGGASPSESQSQEGRVHENQDEEVPAAPATQSPESLAIEGPTLEDPTSDAATSDPSLPIEAGGASGVDQPVGSLGTDSSSLVVDAAAVDDDVESGKGASLPMSPSSELVSSFGIPIEDKRILRCA